MSASTSSEIFEQLTAEAPGRRKETLNRLKAACDDLHPHGRFRLQDIERRISDRFGKECGPRAQTISNEKSLPLGMYHYVAARRREAETSIRVRTGRQYGQANIAQSIDAVEDFDLRNLMRDVYDRMLIAEAASTRAKHILRVSRPGVDIEGLITGTLKEPQPVLEEKAIGTLRALRSILTNEEKLSSCGLTCENGQIRRKGRLGDELFAASLMRDFLDLCGHVDRL